jgi:predicted metal-dependent enzyme (double-stranded beta helix superfamily)
MIGGGDLLELASIVRGRCETETGRASIGSLLAQWRPDITSVESQLHFPKAGYARHLIYADRTVECLLLCWDASAVSPIHDHAGQRCWMMTVSGALEVADYDLVAAGNGKGESVARTGSATLGPGQVDARSAGGAMHAVATAGAARAVSLHVYTKPIERCSIYDAPAQQLRSHRLTIDRVLRF